jgi:hypothetical protein
VPKNRLETLGNQPDTRSTLDAQQLDAL